MCKDFGLSSLRRSTPMIACIWKSNKDEELDEIVDNVLNCGFQHPPHIWFTLSFFPHLGFAFLIAFGLYDYELLCELVFFLPLPPTLCAFILSIEDNAPF